MIDRTKEFLAVRSLIARFLLAALVGFCVRVGAADPIFSEGSGVTAGETLRTDLATLVPASIGLVAPYRFAVSGTKPDWVTLSGTTLVATPPIGQVVLGLPVFINLTVTDSARTPAVNAASFMIVPVAAAPIFVSGLGAVAGGTAEMNLSDLVPSVIGLVPPYRFAFDGTKPDWVTLNGTSLRLTPPLGTAKSAAPVAVGLTVTDSASVPVVKSARANVAGVVHALVEGLDGGVVVGFSDGTTSRLDVGVVGRVGSGGWSGGVLRQNSVASTAEVAVFEVVGLPPVGTVAPTPSTMKVVGTVEVTSTLKRVAIVTKAGRTEVSVPSATPLFAVPVAVISGGSPVEVDLLAASRSGSAGALSEPFTFTLVAGAPSWASLSGSTMRVSPSKEVAASGVPVRIKLKIEDASAVTVYRDGYVDVQVYAPPELTLVEGLDGGVVVGFSDGTTSRLDVGVVGRVGSGGWSGGVLRRNSAASTAEVAVFEVVGLPPVGMVAPTPSTMKVVGTVEVTSTLKRVAIVTKAGRTEVSVPSAPPLFAVPVAVISGGSPVEVDLLAASRSGSAGALSEPFTFSLVAGAPSWVSLSGSTLLVAPPDSVLPTASYLRVGINVTDSSTVVINRDAFIDVRVTAPVLIPPSILRQPVGAALSGSGFVTLVVSAKGSGTLRYVWQKDGKPILGAASATYVAREVGNYSVVVIDGKASSTSSVAVVAGMAPVIVKQPVGGSVDSSGSVVLTVTANGTGPLNYQWMRDQVAVDGGTAPALRVTRGGVYSVRVSNLHGEIGSAPVTIKSSSNLAWFAGEYVGLMVPRGTGEEAEAAYSGLVSVVVTRAGSVTGRILRRVGPARAFTGSCDENGVIVFGRGSSPAWMVGNAPMGDLSLNIPPSDPSRRMVGKVVAVSGGNTVEQAGLLAVPTRSVQSVESGRYTAVLRGRAPQTIAEPFGVGASTFTAMGTGLSFSGKMADGSPISFSSKMREDASVPVFVPLYGGRGSLAGTVRFDLKGATSDAEGLGMKWCRDRGEVVAGNYPDGWPSGIVLDLFASRFDPNRGLGSGMMAGAQLGFTAVGGGLVSTVEEGLSVSRSGSLLPSPSSVPRIRPRFSVASGWVEGTFLPRSGAVPIPYTGVVLQKSGQASGFFIDNRLSGRFGIVPIVP